MPRSNTGPGGRTLTGGRALYTGKNAYASQGFENDIRVSQLGGLLIANLQGDGTQAVTGGIENTVLFPSLVVSRITPPAVFMRGFTYNNAGTFACRVTGTFRFSISVRLTSLAANTLAQATLRVIRGADVIRFTFTNVNATANSTDGVAITGNHYVDLAKGDQISLLIDPGSNTTLRGTTEGASAFGGLQAIVRQTYMSFEQIDLT